IERGGGDNVDRPTCSVENLACSTAVSAVLTDLVCGKPGDPSLERRQHGRDARATVGRFNGARPTLNVQRRTGGGERGMWVVWNLPDAAGGEVIGGRERATIRVL